MCAPVVPAVAASHFEIVTKNVFAIRTPVAIAVGVRAGAPYPDTPSKVWKVKLTGPEQAKLEALDGIESFDDLEWRECSSEWDAPFYPAGTGAVLRLAGGYGRVPMAALRGTAEANMADRRNSRVAHRPVARPT